MAFAQNTNGSKGGQPYVTEKDLMRQVASNMTKEALVMTKTKILGGDRDGGGDEDASTVQSISEQRLNHQNAPSAKKRMLENLAKIQKVWYTFVKTVRNQVMINGKLVDTTMIGLFCRDEATDKVIYLPSADFMQAGKFKLHKETSALLSETAGTDGQSMLELYNLRYNEKLAETPKSG